MDGYDQLIQFLEELESVQTTLDVKLYFVGGCVRDALFGVPSTDFDIAVERDLSKIIDAFESRFIMKPSQFGTTTVKFGVYHVDFAEMRREHYPDLSGLPIISTGTIESDLNRRDFSINTGYVRLTKTSIDAILLRNSLSKAMIVYSHPRFYEDIEQKKLRALHFGSFKEDATRMLRAVKYLVNFELMFEIETEKQFAKGIEEKWYDNCSEDRYKKILLNYAEHENWKALLSVVHHYGLFQREPSMSLNRFESTLNQLDALEKKYGSYEKSIVLLLLIYEHDLSYWRGSSRKISSNANTCQMIIEQMTIDKSDENCYSLFSEASKEVIMFFYLRDPNEGEFTQFIDKLLSGKAVLKVHISGRDLLDLGISEGEIMGRIFKDLLKYERSIQKKLSKKEELEWVERRIHEYRN